MQLLHRLDWKRKADFLIQLNNSVSQNDRVKLAQVTSKISLHSNVEFHTDVFDLFGKLTIDWIKLGPGLTLSIFQSTPLYMFVE